MNTLPHRICGNGFQFHHLILMKGVRVMESYVLWILATQLACAAPFPWQQGAHQSSFSIYSTAAALFDTFSTDAPPPQLHFQLQHYQSPGREDCPESLQPACTLAAGESVLILQQLAQLMQLMLDCKLEEALNHTTLLGSPPVQDYSPPEVLLQSVGGGGGAGFQVLCGDLPVIVIGGGGGGGYQDELPNLAGGGGAGMQVIPLQGYSPDAEYISFGGGSGLDGKVESDASSSEPETMCRALTLAKDYAKLCGDMQLLRIVGGGGAGAGICEIEPDGSCIVRRALGYGFGFSFGWNSTSSESQSPSEGSSNPDYGNIFSQAANMTLKVCGGYSDYRTCFCPTFKKFLDEMNSTVPIVCPPVESIL